MLLQLGAFSLLQLQPPSTAPQHHSTTAPPSGSKSRIRSLDVKLNQWGCEERKEDTACFLILQKFCSQLLGPKLFCFRRHLRWCFKKPKSSFNTFHFVHTLVSKYRKKTKHEAFTPIKLTFKVAGTPIPRCRN